MEECITRARANGQEYLVEVIRRMNKNIEWPKVSLYEE